MLSCIAADCMSTILRGIVDKQHPSLEAILYRGEASNKNRASSDTSTTPTVTHSKEVTPSPVRLAEVQRSKPCQKLCSGCIKPTLHACSMRHDRFETSCCKTARTATFSTYAIGRQNLRTERAVLTDQSTTFGATRYLSPSKQGKLEKYTYLSNR